jgi:hypothetical protein
VVTLTGLATATTTTDSTGAYTFTGLAAGDYTVAPAQPDVTFAPGSRRFATLAANATADFTATRRFTLAGRVTDANGSGLAGVTMTLTGTAAGTEPRTQATDEDGRYAFTGLGEGGTATITPVLDGFAFAPASRSAAALGATDAAASFSAIGTAIGTFRRFFAEGAIGSFFDTDVALLNGTAETAHARLRFQTGGGGEFVRDLTMPPMTRTTIGAETVPGLAAAAADFATVVESDVPIVADRTMRWDASGYGSHAETSVAGPQATWYFAEGSTTGDFSLFYLLQNPGPVAAQVEIRYLRPAPLAPVVRTYTVGAASRRTLFVNNEDPALAETDVSAAIVSTNGVPIIAERAMYTNAGGRTFGAGHESAGIPAPAPQWFLAEGATGSFFHEFILAANPTETDAPLEFRYLLSDGRVITRMHTVAANSRLTIGVHTEDPALASAAVSTIVTSTTGVPVLVERAVW